MPPVYRVFSGIASVFPLYGTEREIRGACWGDLSVNWAALWMRERQDEWPRNGDGPPDRSRAAVVSRVVLVTIRFVVR